AQPAGRHRFLASLIFYLFSASLTRRAMLILPRFSEVNFYIIYKKMLELIREPWPWYTSGLVITLVMVLLLFFGKSFGFSSNFRIICAACGAGKTIDFFDFNWRAQTWNLVFL